MNSKNELAVLRYLAAAGKQTYRAIVQGTELSDAEASKAVSNLAVADLLVEKNGYARDDRGAPRPQTWYTINAAEVVNLAVAAGSLYEFKNQ